MAEVETEEATEANTEEVETDAAVKNKLDTIYELDKLFQWIIHVVL